jgi:hypothetical protein
MSPSRLSIDRLTLRVAGMSEDEGEALADLVARGLAAAGGSRVAAGRRDIRRVEVTAPADAKGERLAGRIVSAILRQLVREP